MECFEVFGRGYWYGTLWNEVTPSLEAGKWVVLEIDVQGPWPSDSVIPTPLRSLSVPGRSRSSSAGLPSGERKRPRPSSAGWPWPDTNWLVPININIKCSTTTLSKPSSGFANILVENGV